MLRLTREQLREIDRRSVEDYHIPSIVLMENAARGAVDVVLNTLKGKIDSRILVICGAGNNGGDGLAVARHLHNLCFRVQLFVAVNPDRYRGDAQTNWRIAEAMHIPRLEAWDEVMRRDFDLIVDAFMGTGLSEAPRLPISNFITMISSWDTPIVAIDVPSGLDCNTGEPLGPCVKATRTVTFVAEKTGFANPASKQYTGEITVADIGCPRELIEQVSRTNQQSSNP